MIEIKITKNATPIDGETIDEKGRSIRFNGLSNNNKITSIKLEVLNNDNVHVSSMSISACDLCNIIDEFDNFKKILLQIENVL